MTQFHEEIRAGPSSASRTLMQNRWPAAHENLAVSFIKTPAVQQQVTRALDRIADVRQTSTGLGR